MPPVVILNKKKDLKIELSRRVISEWRIKSRTRERILSIQLLDKMLENAEFIMSVEDFNKTPGIESVSYFENKCKINGRLFKISITIKSQTKIPETSFIIIRQQKSIKNNHIRWVKYAYPYGCAWPRRTWLQATACL